MKWVKPLLIIAVVLFALFFLVARPEQAGDAVQGVLAAVVTGVDAVGRFFSSLVS